MPIELNSNIPLPRPNNNSNAISDHQEIIEGNSEIEAEDSKSQSEVNITADARKLQLLFDAIAEETGIDSQKVAEVKAKIANGEFDILANDHGTRLQAARNIADNIIDIESKIP